MNIDDLTPVVRALANLARLTKANAAPILPALREKFDALLRDADALLAKRTGRFTG